ncbi:MAG: bifunctional aspartate kinase/homoserine dehydrogenase I [Bacteroidales bacterium]|nr:bifunctional aspartate kinase/homoserine dehydrogenase I [Bacteroidales bacterium]
MRVLKFGGTSVGTAEALQQVKQIVEGRRERLIVVVSALGGVTDQLLAAAAMAERGDAGYLTAYEDLAARHRSLVAALFGARPGMAAGTETAPCAPADARKALPGTGVPGSGMPRIEALLSELRMRLDGVFTLQVLPRKTRDEIVSYGERLTARIAAALIEGAQLYDALDFIRTVREQGRDRLDTPETETLVRQTFTPEAPIAIVPGFIARDTASGEITNLGRGGSDYTASILAASLDAEALEIWTDVDGFMTADPRIIKTSYVIDTLSFAEAMELCHFGAKVVYAPALYPVYHKDIPVHIKNTFNLSAPGTTICRTHPARHPVTGIASISDIALVTVSAPSLVGLIGVDSRMFGALSRRGISVFLVSQSSSETGIVFGVSNADAEAARQTLDDEFAAEISHGAMRPADVEKNLAAVSVVGEGMKYSKGIAGKLFTILGRNGIGVLACAQGSSDYNISLVVEQKYLRKSLNVIHDSFFLSEYQELNLFICGIGTVGGQLIEQIRLQRERLMRERNLKLNIVGIARSVKGLFDREGVDLVDYQERLTEGIDLTPARLRDEVIGMNIFNSVFVDCTASAEIAALYREFLDHGISVVTANKIAASSDYSNYKELKTTSLKRGVKFLFETNVGAGLPIINTINALKNSGDRIEKIEAVLSGTLNFIFNTISAEVPFSRTVRMAQEQGFSEPDPRIDLSGKDVIRKLVILAREAGYEVEQSQVEAHLFVPDDFFTCSMEEFWERLPSLDARFEAERQRLEAEQKRWRFVAKMENGRYSVSLQEIPMGHSFYVLEGSNNIILLTTERYHQHPMLIQGYGAGASVTAAGVFADIMSIANI